MLSKLAFRNVKRSIKDYVIYIITVTLAFAFIFAFNLIANSPDIMSLNELMDNFQFVMILVSIIVVFVLSYLINYTIKFMFEKRSKEFGTYLILGIERKDITKMFLLENLILGILCLVISFGVGLLFSQFLTYIIMNIFNQPYQIFFNTSLALPIVLSVIYFVFIYAFVLFLSSQRIKKKKIYDLLALQKRNEKKLFKKRKYAILIFILAIVMGIGGLLLLSGTFQSVGKEPSFKIILLAAVLIIISLYSLSFSLPDILISFVLKKPKMKYNKDNLFVIRQFTSKIKTMSFTIGTLSLLIVLTLISLNVSTMFNGIFDEQVNLIAPYDVTLIDDPDKFNAYRDVIKKDYTILEEKQVTQYIDENNSIRQFLLDEDLGWNQNELVVSLSDYNAMLRLKGLEPITLSSSEFWIHASKMLETGFKDIQDNFNSITLSNQKQFHLKAIVYDHYSSVWSYGSGYLIVVPDESTVGLEKYTDMLIFDVKEETNSQLYHDLVKLRTPELCQVNDQGYTICSSITNISVRGEVVAQNNSTMTILSFSLFYLAFTFTAVVGTILAIQALSDSTKYKYRYQLLSKLGVEKQMIHKTIRKQLFIFFIFPLVFPIIISFSTIATMNKVFKPFLASNYQYLYLFLGSLGVFLSVYIIYYLATYFSFKKNIGE